MDSLLQQARQYAEAEDGTMLAQKFYLMAFYKAQANEYLFGEAQALRGLNQVEMRQNPQKEQIMERFRGELALREALPHPLELARTYEQVGDFCEIHLQAFAQALGYFRQSAWLRERFKGGGDTLAQTQEKIVRLYKLSQTPGRAIVFLEKLLRHYTHTQQNEPLIYAHLDLASLWAQKKDLTKAYFHLQAARRHYAKMPPDFLAAQAIDWSKVEHLLKSAALKEIKSSENSRLIYLQIALGMFALFMLGFGLFVKRGKRKKPHP
ncbi:MAG: hypothetical protein HC913_00125 [Microscillaceae bacterium]|nr:hypothetical protein [Microscillaceae bacterium]